jgi:glycosyltransferase involved in cell wall biosynthesis
MLPLMARAANTNRQKGVILAPRGEFSPGALQLKWLRKRVFIEAARRLPVYKNLTWHASSRLEEGDIRRLFGSKAAVRVALDISRPECRAADLGRTGTNKIPGALRIVFLSRIVPKKNLLTALRMLKDIQGAIEFNIYGPPEDASYWNLCLEEIHTLPRNIGVEFHSLADHSTVEAIFSTHHLFLFPTLGENYGHVIYEALSAGCPVLISDRTPWRGLARTGAGWDFPLEQPELFRTALAHCVALTDSQFQAASASARAFAHSFINSHDLLAAHLALFASPEVPVRA